MFLSVLLPLVSSIGYVTAAGPTVKVDSATFVGRNIGNTETFLGIPYAEPPTGNNRFRAPKLLQRYKGTFNASESGPMCPQLHIRIPTHEIIPPQVLAALSGVNSVQPQDEDCLTIDVIRPANIPPSTKLPVAVWIYGGAFQVGSTRDYNGTSIVERSIALGKPLLYVAMNYRVSGFGFMPGKEVKDAKVGNLGLRDHRAALHWVKKHITRFGGDASQATIWGLSAGAVSVALQMTTNGGNSEGLFHGAVMQSGAMFPVGGLERGQKYYDAIVADTGCSGVQDTLACLRQVPFLSLKQAIDRHPSSLSYEGLVLAYGPRVDGEFIKDHPSRLVRSGQVAMIPMIQGDTDDEGTLFALSSANLTTSQQVKEYFQEAFPNASDVELNSLLTEYPEDLEAGSPFDTGSQNALTPQFKRIAAIWGDIAFQAPRRYLLEKVSNIQPSWAYLLKRPKQFPYLGALHGGGNLYAGGELTDYLVHFVTHLDPNGPESAHWPKYTNSQPNMLTLHDTEPLVNVTQDTFRETAIAFLNKFLVKNPL